MMTASNYFMSIFTGTHITYIIGYNLSVYFSYGVSVSSLCHINIWKAEAVFLWESY